MIKSRRCCGYTLIERWSLQQWEVFVYCAGFLIDGIILNGIGGIWKDGIRFILPRAYIYRLLNTGAMGF